jgi:5,10-methylene-tetrahydrofolate dehydrogenase/methenyl tetrahydrofolate cyclohydrolase
MSLRVWGPDGKLHGDVDFERVKDIASFITPGAKGSGPSETGLLLTLAHFDMLSTCRDSLV